MIEPSADKVAGERDIRELIDASSNLKRLIVQARELGTVTFDEISLAMSDEEVTPEQFEELTALFEDMGVAVEREDSHCGGSSKGESEFGDETANAIPISNARQDLAELCNRVAYGGERLVIARRGKARAALVSMADLKLLRALEDAVDLAAARRALSETGQAGTKRLEEVLQDLGLNFEVT